jgi:hypothetical protein
MKCDDILTFQDEFLDIYWFHWCGSSEIEEHTNYVFLYFQESVAGAKQFVSGVGRHGKSFNITERKQTQPVQSKI